MENAFPFSVMLLILMLFVARLLLLLLHGPATSTRIWPWLRLRSWWPIAADRAAETLLRSSLTPQQYRKLCATAYLDVLSPSRPERVYQVPRGPGQVLVVESGRVTERLCVQPVESLPEADVILLHKLLIEADERTYLATANHFPRAVWR